MACFFLNLILQAKVRAWVQDSSCKQKPVISPAAGLLMSADDLPGFNPRQNDQG